MAATLAPEPAADPSAEQPSLRPQPGPQETFLSTPADIAVIGGSVFGGKTWALCYEPLRHIGNSGFTFVAFRRTTPEIRNPGGMWDESVKTYPLVGGEPRETTLDWYFPSGARGKMAGLQYDSTVLDWKGAQVALLLFDQLEEFTEKQFFYMLSRNRSTCGVRPYVRASCNPDPDSFIAVFLAWWIDQETGYAIAERSGTVRWFVRVNDEIHWSNVTCGVDEYPDVRRIGHEAKADLIAKLGPAGRFAKSVTFVRASITDNKIGTDLDPEYEANVRALSHVEQERLLGGNWKIRAAAGLVFNRGWFEIVDAAPVNARRVRGWDKAGTAGDGDWTAGVKMAKASGIYYVEDVIRMQSAAGAREAVIRQSAELDGIATDQWLEQEPGSGGKDSARDTIQNLSGYTVHAQTATGDKVTRANPFAAQAQVGNVRIVRGHWNEAYLRELHAFPTKGVPDDQVDASSLAFSKLKPEPAPLPGTHSYRSLRP